MERNSKQKNQIYTSIGKKCEWIYLKKIFLSEKVSVNKMENPEAIKERLQNWTELNRVDFI